MVSAITSGAVGAERGSFQFPCTQESLRFECTLINQQVGLREASYKNLLASIRSKLVNLKSINVVCTLAGNFFVMKDCIPSDLKLRGSVADSIEETQKCL